MENLRSNWNSSEPKLKRSNSLASPTNAHMDNHLVIGGSSRYHQQSYSKRPVLEPYAENLDLPSPILWYLNSRSPVEGKPLTVPATFSSPLIDVSNQYLSEIVHQYSSNSSGNGSFGSRGGRSSVSPLSAIENLETPPSRSSPVYVTKVKVDEEVLVMDGILVESAPAKNIRSSDSGGGGIGGLSSLSVKSQFKTETCRSWEDFGTCRYGYKCQFAHGKEEMRPSRFSTKSKSEICMPHTAGSPKSHFGPLVATTTAVAEMRDLTNKPDQTRRVYLATAPLIEAASLTTQKASPSRLKPSDPLPTATATSCDWSPEDDGIMVTLPYSATEKTPTREDVNAHIGAILHGSTSRRRLPVFTEICPQ